MSNQAIKYLFVIIATALFTGAIVDTYTRPQGFRQCRAEITKQYADVGAIADPGTTFLSASGSVGFVGFVDVAGKQLVYSCTVKDGQITDLSVGADDLILRAFAEGK